jgi:hypothetical protein
VSDDRFLVNNEPLTTMCNAIHEVENCICPNCGKPLALLRGFDADCKPITIPTHRVDLRSFRLGVFAVPH